MRIVLLTALAMLAFAGNSLLCRIALRDTAIDAASFTAIRIASGALMLAILLRAQGKRPMAGGSWLAALMLFSYAAFFSFAYRDLSAATGALLLFGAVQMTMMGFGLFSGERLGPVKLGGLAIALGGLIALLLPGLAAPPLLGASFMVAAGVSWGVYSILGKGLGEPTAATGGNFMRAVPFAAALGLAAMNHSSVDLHGALTPFCRAPSRRAWATHCGTPHSRRSAPPRPPSSSSACPRSRRWAAWCCCRSR